MDSLANIARSGTPSLGIQFRRPAYGKAGVREFLRDVLAMANAPVDGPRYIVVGSSFDQRGRRQFENIDINDFGGKTDYVAIASSYIEPPVQIRYEAVVVDDHQLGVYEISDCRDRPYMMRIDHSETLRRGDAYVRSNNRAIKMGRRQLQSLFEEKFHEAVSSDNIEVGFPGDIIHKDLSVTTGDLDKRPSAVAIAKLEEMLKVKSRINSRGSTTVLARLTHARLFGPDDPYRVRSREDILHEMREVESRCAAEDAHYLYEQNARHLQLVIYNQGEETIRDATLSIAMPNPDGFYVASELPPVLRAGEYAAPTQAEQSAYPSVTLKESAVQVSGKIGDIKPGEQVQLFESPLRIFAARNLAGRRFAVTYALYAQNLRAPTRGRLRLRFNAGQEYPKSESG